MKKEQEWLKTVKILAVDDDRTTTEQLKKILQSEGYAVLLASSGEEALEIISKQDISVILLDVKMPGIDGFEVTRKVRAGTLSRFTPIILITVLNDASSRAKGIELGCDDFISKPFDRDVLLAKIRSLLKVKFLHNELETNYSKLQELEATRKSMTRVIVHELNNQVAVISGNMELLKMVGESNFSKEQNDKLNRALSSTEDIFATIKALLDVSDDKETNN